MKIIPVERRRGHCQVRQTSEPFKQFCIRMEPALFVRLQGLARYRGMSIASIASAALADALGKVEVNHATTP